MPKKPDEDEITLREAIQELAKKVKPFTIEEMVRKLDERYPGKWKESAIRAHITALNVRASKGVKKWQKSLHQHAFLMKIAKGENKGKYTIAS